MKEKDDARASERTEKKMERRNEKMKAEKSLDKGHAIFETCYALQLNHKYLGNLD